MLKKAVTQVRADEIRNLSADEQQDKISELKEELFNLRFQQATGQLENPMRIREVKKTIARIKTIMHEAKLGIRAQSKKIFVALRFWGVWIEIKIQCSPKVFTIGQRCVVRQRVYPLKCVCLYLSMADTTIKTIMHEAKLGIRQ